jgi:hypothetical protein
MKPVLSNWLNLHSAQLQRLRRAIFVLLGLSLCACMHANAQTCPPESAIPSKRKPVTYKVENEALIRVDTQTGMESVVKEVGKVTSAGHSVLNCDNKDRVQTEPNLLAVLKEDGTVWVKGLIWQYNRQVDNIPAEKVFDTKKKWLQATGLRDVIKIAVGETWVIALHQDRTVSMWGANIWGGGMGTHEERVKNVPLIQQSSRKVFNFPAYIDIMTYHSAVYGLLADGQVTVMGGYFLCHIPHERFYVTPGHSCPFITPSPEDGGVKRVWQTLGNPAQCNAEFIKGQHWVWPCDDISYQDAGGARIKPFRLGSIEKRASIRGQ